MNNFYIYRFDYNLYDEESNINLNKSATVIFCERSKIEEDLLQKDIKKFYETNYKTDEVYVIAGKYIKEEKLLEIFINRLDDTFSGIPKINKDYLLDHLYIITFDKLGILNSFYKNKQIPKDFEKKYLNEGLQNIFKKRGGLVTSSGKHHFVFPSGKHSDRFLRVANILINSSEIYFIAFALLEKFNEETNKQIYCDTSSINIIAFSLVELKNRFLDPENRKQIPIKSFGSYKGLFEKDISYEKTDLLLISASTSGSIITYIFSNQKNINRSNINILFFLGKEKDYDNIKDQLLCNLTKSEENPTGIDFYPTYKDNCKYCENGSYPVEIQGDAFSLEKPKINRIILTVNDPNKNLSSFVSQFISKNKINIIKSNYKDNNDNIYPVFIDYNNIINNISSYKKYESKLNNCINQYVPSNTKYIISLEDQASKKLADYILDKIKDNYIDSKKPKIINIDDIKNINEKEEGAVLIVASCISNGKNLLYVSRALRKYDKLRLIYFAGIVLTRNEKLLTFLKSNLTQGSVTNSFIEVETLYCTDHSKESSWSKEIKFIDNLLEILDSKNTYINNYLNNRKLLLESSLNKEKISPLFNNLFYPRFLGNNKYEELKIRKNFAFFKFENYVDNATQADIFFTISNILNTLRNSDKSDRTLKQDTFVRNIIDPSNFNRFNDGIIQASILRSTFPEELNYSLDSDLSSEMTNILETIIRYYSEEQGEALLEFLYAIATRKLSLKKYDLKRVIELIEEECKNENIILNFSEFIKKEILEDK